MLILVPPVIITFERNSTADVGQTAELECGSRGIPHPQITWFFEGQPVDLSDPRFTLENDGTLRIDDAREDDEGFYTCRVHNPAGVENRSAILDIKCNASVN